jgi:hypothetical protein
MQKCLIKRKGCLNAGRYKIINRLEEWQLSKAVIIVVSRQENTPLYTRHFLVENYFKVFITEPNRIH